MGRDWNVIANKTIDVSFLAPRISNKDSKVIGLPWRRLSVAASIIVLLMAGMWWLDNSSSLKPEDLYTSYYEQPLLSLPRSSDQDEQWNTIVNTYAKKDYETAIDLLERYTKEASGPKEQAKFYLGICYLESLNIDKAISTFGSVKTSSIYHPNAIWHIGLSYLKLGKVEDAKMIFESIVKQGAYKSKESRAILDKMKY